MTDNTPVVTLIDGRSVSSWGREWLEETRDREMLAIALMKLPDRDTRRARLDAYQAQVVAAYTASGHLDPVAVGAEARKRAEATTLARWERQRALSFAAT